LFISHASELCLQLYGKEHESRMDERGDLYNNHFL